MESAVFQDEDGLDSTALAPAPPASSFQMLGLQVCSIMPGSYACFSNNSRHVSSIFSSSINQAHFGGGGGGREERTLFLLFPTYSKAWQTFFHFIVSF